MLLFVLLSPLTIYKNECENISNLLFAVVWMPFDFYPNISS